MNIGFLASGYLGFKIMRSLIERIPPVFIGTDSKSTEIIQLAEEFSVPIFIGNPRNGRLANFLKDIKTDVMISTNYLFLLDQDVIKKVKYPINLHGSLLPKYRGRTPHVWAIINNEKHTGITAHLIDNECDTGDVVIQKKINISPEATGADMLKSFEEIYPVMILEIVHNIENDVVTTTKQDNSKATYFGKRSPQDGLINWNWYKERIYNWVRAQAYPYPGAFTTFQGKKIIIDKVRFSDQGYNCSDPNGLVLIDDINVVIKTPNGAVEFLEIREGRNFIKKGIVLGT